jgi:HK97 family phage major capsid protein
MILTQSLKSWLVEHKGVAADAEDSAFTAAVTDALTDGSLSPAKLAELTVTKEDAQASQLEKTLQSILDGQKTLNDRIDTIEKKPEAKPEEEKKEEKKPELKKDAPKIPDGEDKPEEKSVFDQMFAGSSTGIDANMPLIRTVGAHEQYDSTRTAKHFPMETKAGMSHPFAGQRVFEGGTSGKRFIDEPSELDRAVCGAYAKLLISGAGKGVPHAMKMTDHDKDLVQYALRHMKWGGVINGIGDEDARGIGVNDAKLSDWQIKAVLDDAASGGLELAPIVFDDAIIMTPLLTGEFFPRVNLVTITRGRRIEGGSIGNVTLSSGGADGTAIPLFNTASFIAAFDTNIYVVNGAIEIGLDFLSDSPVAVADVVTGQYGTVLLNWLDEQCVLGDGTTEPEGVNVASGTVSVNAANGAGGPPTVGDYEALLFGVPKQYKQGFPTNRITYGANETSYQRARSIAVGTTDARRVFGMTHEDYQMFGHPYAIGTAIGNRAINFVNWGRYRMYRRAGLTLRATTEGKELVRANQMLITARARFGGQLEDGNAAAVMADAQS